MVEFLNTWAQRIIVVVIICTIIEMILPEGKNKKYIKTVTGLYVVFTIISPIISKINLKESLNLEKYLNFSEENTVETSVILDNNKYIEELYKENLSSDIIAKIRVLGYDVASINVDIETKNEETYGSILSLKLKIVKNNEDKKENKIQIEPVIIGKEKLNEEIELPSEEIEKIKEYLETIYYIDKEKINVE